MHKRSISEGRRFSLKTPISHTLLEGGQLQVRSLYFEAGQVFTPDPGEAAYQVLEGDALFMDANGPSRAHKGEVMLGAPAEIENAGGGLLVILETRQRAS